MVDGEWKAGGLPKDGRGHFARPPTSFRDQVTADGSSGFPAEAGRYHLYISLACPWAHRTAILRKLKGMQGVVSLSGVEAYMGVGGWAFSDGSGTFTDPLYGLSYLREVYKKADPVYTVRVSTPVLWNKETGTIVDNEPREIVRMLDTEFGGLATSDADYEPINNGVYRSGLATTQEAYEGAVTEPFDALEHWEDVLGTRRYLAGDRITEADWLLFATLVRFDAVYVDHFECNLGRTVDYPNPWNYTRNLYQQPGVAGAVRVEDINKHTTRDTRTSTLPASSPKVPSSVSASPTTAIRRTPRPLRRPPTPGASRVTGGGTTAGQSGGLAATCPCRAPPGPSGISLLHGL